MEEQERGRHLDLISRLKFKKLEKEVSESENQLAKDLLVVIDKLNVVIEKKLSETDDNGYDDGVDQTDYNYRPFE